MSIAKDTPETVPLPRPGTAATATLRAMAIGVYSSPDGRGRCIRYDDETPPLVLIATFLEDEEDDAWELLHELGGQPSVA